MDALIAWAFRSIHILGAGFWLGGYAIMLFVIVPHLARERNETVRSIALALVRVLSFSGTLTIVAGLVLIWRTRGYGSLIGGEWGGIIITCIVLAVALMGIGDSGLRPAVRRLAPERPETVGAVRRWALAGLVVTMVVLSLMTRAIYART
jgi:putative copper export protein